ncbi:MAG: hypothetical protein ACXVCY_04200 [Pseudobdellovibrionaceae bacterium]
MNSRNATLVGEALTLGYRNLVSGVLKDAQNIISVRILDYALQVIYEVPAANIFHDDFGMYRAEIPAGVLSKVGSFTEQWQVAQIDNSQTTTQFTIEVTNTREPEKQDFAKILSITLADLSPYILKKNYLWPVLDLLSNYNLSDRSIQNTIDVMTSQASRRLGMPLRQVRVITRPFNPKKPIPIKGVDYDEEGKLVPWSAVGSDSWFSFSLPRQDIIRVRSIRGVIGDRAVYEIPDAWVDRNELQTGYVRIRATSLGVATAIIDPQGMILDPGLFGVNGSNTVPGFWAVDFDYGSVNDEIPLEVGDAILKMAAVRVLEQLSMAITQGIGSRSASVDGTSSSVGYLANTERGMFSALASNYQSDLQFVDWNEMKKAYKGLSVFIF